jgi:hypothetical protein
LGLPLLPGSGLSNLDQIQQGISNTQDFMSQLPVGSNPWNSANASLQNQYGNFSAELDASYTSGGSLSGYGAFGLEGAEGISAAGTLGLMGAAATAGWGLGQAINSIPIGGGNTVGGAIENWGYNVIGGLLYGN